jgi:ABC-type transport system substrate-binding protein
MLNRRNFLYTLAGFTLALSAGCSRAPREPGVLHMAQESDASTLDPARAYDTTCIPYVRVLYRGLVDYDDDANLVNEVARSHEISLDGKTFTFQLRDDVFFHSGRRVVAEDFRYAIERVLDPATASDGRSFFGVIEGAEAWEAEMKKPAAQRKLRHISGIEVRGDDTLIFHLTKPDVTFLNVLALPFAYAVPRETVEKWGKAFGENPNGNGPFRFKEWVHDGWLILEKNPKYFRPDLPRANRIEVHFGNSSTLQIMRFEQGQTDVINISDANPPDYLRLKNAPRWQASIQHAPMMDIRYLCMNTQKKPFDNVLVRRAMNYAINRQRIASVLAGRATLARGPLPPGMPGYNSNLQGYDYDPARAKALIKEAGYEGKFPQITLWYSTNEPWYGKAAQTIQADLKAIGISINIKGVRYAELKTMAGRKGQIEMSLMGWLQDFPDPSNFLDPLFNARSISNEASLNRAFYSNPKVNQLLDTALVEQNREKRLTMYQEAEQQIVQDAPLVFLHHTERYVTHQPWIEGYKLHPMWSERLEFVKPG